MSFSCGFTIHEDIIFPLAAESQPLLFSLLFTIEKGFSKSYLHITI